MTDVVIWHNIGTDYQGRNVGFSDGYRPGHPLVPVYQYECTTAGEPEDVANDAFRVFNVGDDPAFGKPDPGAQRYRALGNRSLSKGDVVQVGQTWLACASRGWDRVSAPEWIARSAQTHGTAPLPREIVLPAPVASPTTCRHCGRVISLFRGHWWTPDDDFMCPDGEQQHQPEGADEPDEERPDGTVRASTAPHVDIVHVRYPDAECHLRVFVDDVEAPEHGVEDIDPGRGYLRSDWDERLAGYEGNKTAFGRAAHQALTEAADSHYIED